jgi:hypothetical protein
MRKFFLIFGLTLLTAGQLRSQSDTTGTEDDFSMYNDVDFVDEGAKRYCSPKIEGLSPAQLIYIGYDVQGPYTMKADPLTNRDGNQISGADEMEIAATHGLRLGCNIPVISTTSLVWQMGFNYWQTNFEGIEQALPVGGRNTVIDQHRNAFRTMGLNTTVFKPLNDKQFLLFQGSGDLNGDYTLSNIMPLRYLKYSGAVIWGKRPTEKKQWGVGLARTYRVGELNYIPVFMYNWTDAANKWGTEILFPARAAVRRTINPRNMVFAGFELQGQSYRLYKDETLRPEDLEIRRGEIRLRMEYQFSVKDFLWVSAQAGYRINYRYHSDRLDGGKETLRAFGLVSDAPYAMESTLTNPFYVSISVNLVSP